MFLNRIAIFIFLVSSIRLYAQTTNDLNPISDKISVYVPSYHVNNRTAVIILPGGGYNSLVLDREGEKIAREFNKSGIVGFVLQYTLPDPRKADKNSFGALIDAQNAIKYIRENSIKWGIDSNKIGVMGFSAGGHLAAALGTHFTFPMIVNKNNTNLRPDFMVLIYPLISFMDSITHLGSRDNLIGKKPSPELKYFFSNEVFVNYQTPATFLTHALDDTIVKPVNSILFYNALRRNNVKSYLKLYSKGEHGFLEEPVFRDWFKEVLKWMKKVNFL